MKPRFMVVLLALVVLPTVLLSLMAARAVGQWDVVLERKLEMEAEAAAQAVAGRVDDAVRHALDQVVTSMAGVQARGGQPTEVRQIAGQLRDSAELIDGVYLFMNPWDFLYPGAVAAADDAAAPTQRDLLLAALRRRIAGAPAPHAPLRFSIGGRYYCFALVSMQGLYAGYDVSWPALRRHIARSLSRGSAGFALCAEGPDLLIAPPGFRRPAAAGGVEIEESLVSAAPTNGAAARRAGLTEAQRSGGRGLGEPGPTPPAEPPMVAVRLAPPFERIRIAAYRTDTGFLREAAATRMRIYGWAIALLALGIAAGGAILVTTAVSEIRQARFRGDYVAGVSHDLRTPLSSMRMLTETLYLESISDPQKRHEFLGVILRETERLSQLIERVLFFVRYGQRSLMVRPGPRDAGKLAVSSVNTFCARHDDTQHGPRTTEYGVVEASQGLRVRVRVAEDLPLVKADEAAMKQVLLNLLDNAVKYGGEREGKDSVQVEVRVRRAAAGRWGRRRAGVRFDVRDFGVGIEPRLLRRIFRPYYRSPRAGASNVSGVGLGLAICRHVVRAHGGRIDVESEVGKGTTFSVWLPAAGGETEEQQMQKIRAKD